MGILDGRPFDPATFQQASEAATPGWLGAALPPAGTPARLASAGRQPFANAPAGPPASAGNPFAALFGGPGAAFSPAGIPAANGPGFGERANAAVMNFLNSHGVLPAIAGAIAGATTGQRADPVGLMQEQQAATVRALVGAGVAPDVAQAATLDPNIMRLIAPQLAAALQARGARAQGAPTTGATVPQQFRSTGKSQVG